MKKCVIIPAYNEEITIRSVIESIPIDYEVIVVDDGSTDTTAQQVGLTRARLIKHDKNLGYCSAIQSGLKECRSDVVVTIDGDGQHNTEDITRLFQVFESTGADLVIGSRFAGTIRENWYDKIIERLFSALVYITCGKWLSDCSCGLKIFKISLAHLVPFLNKTAGWHQLICVVALKKII